MPFECKAGIGCTADTQNVTGWGGVEARFVAGALARELMLEPIPLADVIPACITEPPAILQGAPRSQAARAARLGHQERIAQREAAAQSSAG